MKKLSKRIILGAVMGMLCGRAAAMAPISQQVTLLVVPSRYSVLQVAFDMVRRYPTILVTYQGGEAGTPLILYAWNGSEWVYITPEDYAQARFLSNLPDKAVLVGDDELLPPELIDATAWCPMRMNVPSIDTAALVNSLAGIYRFRARDWEWFAARYNLNLVDLNEDRRRKSWYDQPYSDVQPIDRQDRLEEVDLYYSDTYLLHEEPDGSVTREEIIVEEEVEIYEPDIPPASEQPVEELPEEPVGGEMSPGPNFDPYDKGTLSPPPFMTRIEGWEDNGDGEVLELEEEAEEIYPVK